ncbi:MAG: KTSC domain-containing protein [bacterium]
MILTRSEGSNPNTGEIEIISCYYDSSNIIMSDYFTKTNKLYIYFSKGIVYSYYNVDKEMYEKFENAESQGKFFAKNLRVNENYPYSKEFKLREYEINDIKKIINEAKSETKNKNNSLDEEKREDI